MWGGEDKMTKSYYVMEVKYVMPFLTLGGEPVDVWIP